MFYREDSTHTPSADEMSNYIANPIWTNFCRHMEQTYHVKPSFTFSKCSMEYGWNAKFKKGRRALCTVYPREGRFAALVVIGQKEKVLFEQELPTFCPAIQQLYHDTKECNGQKWLFIELGEDDPKYDDVKRVIHIRTC